MKTLLTSIPCLLTVLALGQTGCTLDATIAEANTGGTGGDGGAPTGGLPGTGGQGGRTQVQALMLSLHPECGEYLSATNPEVKNGIVSFDCGAAVDGPHYYHDLATGDLVSTCGGACMDPDDAQQTVCTMLCPPPAFGDCLPATFDTATVPQCAATELCLAPTLGVRSTTGQWSCAGIDGSELCRGTTYQMFVYEDAHIAMQLNFAPSIVGSYSTETLRAALNYWSVNLKLPALTHSVPGFPDEETDFSSMWSGESAADFSTFEYVDGKLRLALSYEVGPVSFATESTHEACRMDDILGMCACTYMPETTAHIVLELPLQQ